MNYLSPFHILPEGFENKPIIDKKTLKQARKVLLAEFELQGKTTILINEREYDKDAILKFFEHLEKDAHLEFHSIIYQNKSLLRFLEKGQIKDYAEAVQFITAKAYPNSESNSNADNFQYFVAPYFVTHYNKLLYNSLRKNISDDLFTLIEQDFPLPPQYEAMAYKDSYRWYHQFLNEATNLKKALEQGQFVSSKQVYELIEPSFMFNFNQLPRYFFDIRDKYAFKLYELIVLLNNRYKRTELARAVLDAGIVLDVDNATHKYYTNADKIIAKKQKERKKFNWLWIYIVAQLMFIIFKISTCNNTSSSSYNSYNYNLPDNLYEVNAVIDSIQKAQMEESFRKNLQELSDLNIDSLIDSRMIDSLTKELENNKWLLDTSLVIPKMSIDTPQNSQNQE